MIGFGGGESPSSSSASYPTAFSTSSILSAAPSLIFGTNKSRTAFNNSSSFLPSDNTSSSGAPYPSRMEGFGSPPPTTAGDSSWTVSAARAITTVADTINGSLASAMVGHYALGASDTRSSVGVGGAPGGYSDRPRPTMNVYGIETANGHSSNNMPYKADASSSSAAVGSQIHVPMQLNGRSGGGATDGQYEEQLLVSLCEAGGIKNSVDENRLHDFLQSAPVLDVSIVGAVLMELLNHDAWQTRFKALVVLAALFDSPSCSKHKQYWYGHSDEFQALTSDSKVSVRAQAMKTLAALQRGSNLLSEDSNEPNTYIQPQALQETTLLEFDNVTPAPASPPPLPPIHSLAAAPARLAHLFDGMSVAGSSTAPRGTHVDLLNSLETLKPTQSAVSSSPQLLVESTQNTNDANLAPSPARTAFDLLAMSPIAPLPAAARVSGSGASVTPSFSAMQHQIQPPVQTPSTHLTKLGSDAPYPLYSHTPAVGASGVSLIA